MSEELEQNNDGTVSGLKKTIIGVITTAVMGLGTWGVTQLTGGGDEPVPAAAAPVINITNSNQQSQQQSAGGKTVIIKEKAVPAQQTTPAAAPAPKPKKDGDEFKEKPAQW
jgi:hypothetical protein